MLYNKINWFFKHFLIFIFLFVFIIPFWLWRCEYLNIFSPPLFIWSS
jgi:hypothetical protein